MNFCKILIFNATEKGLNFRPFRSNPSTGFSSLHQNPFPKKMFVSFLRSQEAREKNYIFKSSTRLREHMVQTLRLKFLGRERERERDWGVQKKEKFLEVFSTKMKCGGGWPEGR